MSQCLEWTKHRQNQCNNGHGRQSSMLDLCDNQRGLQEFEVSGPVHDPVILLWGLIPQDAVELRLWSPAAERPSILGASVLTGALHL